MIYMYRKLKNTREDDNFVVAQVPWEGDELSFFAEENDDGRNQYMIDFMAITKDECQGLTFFVVEEE